MKAFNSDAELIQHAEWLFNEKLSTLERDVNHCLKPRAAAFPAMLFCFSNIDLLGSLYCGQASSKHGRASPNAKLYMRKVMGYSEEQVHLLQQVFRHKIVHLANPKSAYKYGNKIITWQYDHDFTHKHLSLEPIPPGASFQPPYTNIRQGVTHYFWVSLKQLVEDIKISVNGPNGYYEQLKQDQEKKNKFDNAVSEMYSPEK